MGLGKTLIFFFSWKKFYFDFLFPVVTVEDLPGIVDTGNDISLLKNIFFLGERKGGGSFVSKGLSQKIKKHTCIHQVEAMACESSLRADWYISGRCDGHDPIDRRLRSCGEFLFRGCYSCECASVVLFLPGKAKNLVLSFFEKKAMKYDEKRTRKNSTCIFWGQKSSFICGQKSFFSLSFSFSLFLLLKKL